MHCPEKVWYLLPGVGVDPDKVTRHDLPEMKKFTFFDHGTYLDPRSYPLGSSGYVEWLSCVPRALRSQALEMMLSVMLVALRLSRSPAGNGNMAVLPMELWSIVLSFLACSEAKPESVVALWDTLTGRALKKYQAALPPTGSCCPKITHNH